MEKSINEYKVIGTGMTDSQKIEYLLDENKLKRGTLTSSMSSNELYIIEYETPSKILLYDYTGSTELEYSMICDDDYIKSDNKYGCLGMFMSGGSGYRLSKLTPEFEYSKHQDIYKLHSYKTDTNDSITYDEFIKLIGESNYEIDLIAHDVKLQEKIKKVEGNENVHYELSLDKDKMCFQYEDNYTNSSLSINIVKEPGDWLNKHRNKVELYINGYEIEMPCLLKEFKELYENKLIDNKVEFASNNNITKIKNGYLFNNEYFEGLDEIMGKIKSDKDNEEDSNE